MKVAVVGLGAVGGLLAHRLVEAGNDVVALARGTTLKAVRAQGLRLSMGGVESQVRIRVECEPRLLGPQALVIIALKAPALAAAAPALQPLIGRDTLVMPAMNGVPWWFLQPLPAGAAPTERRLASVDPNEEIAAALPLRQVLGCVVHLSCASAEPGRVVHGFGRRLIVGEPGGGMSARVAAVCDVLSGAGFEPEATAEIRREIWFKLWGNMTINPVSALTGATADRIHDDPLVRAFLLRVMDEAAQIGRAVGCPIDESGEARMAVTRQLGAFKTSMLQDVLSHRPIELDALVTAVREIGLRLGLPTPNIDTVLGLTRLMARERGLYGDTPHTGEARPQTLS